jgi:hypothetical protein
MRLAIVVPTILIAASLAATAQQPAAKPAPKSAARGSTIEPAPASELPVTRVALYKNGVGFFEHSGHVTGNQQVAIDFTTAQLNDVLQSLTAIDLNGGRIAGAGYNSTTPLEQQLKALPLALDEDPTSDEFYGAIRGAHVDVHSAANTITGRLLNIETTKGAAGVNQPAQEKRLITVIGDLGEVRTVELTPSTDVRLLDTGLQKEVTHYLQLLASTRNQGLRHLTLEDNGTGSRELSVSYISEVPIWKSTYRILFTSPQTAATQASVVSAARGGPQTATLQGWSVVDNTTGSDWNNVQLSLIAGAPQSFIQPLSVPYYSRRPQVGLPQAVQLTPQTHESGELASELKALAGPSSGPSGGQIYVDGFIGGQLPAGAGRGDGGGIQRTDIQQRLMATASNNASANVISGAALDALSSDPNELTAQLNALSGRMYQQAARNSLVPTTTTAAFDDYFAYNLAEPITIHKNESAMVPILQTKVDAEPVTLVRYVTPWSTSQPLRALWITNTSGLTLDRGSFALIEDGKFGGEGLLDPIHPNEKRLLSYAVDQAVRVTTQDHSGEIGASKLTITASKGVLHVARTQIDFLTYVIRNSAPEARTVLFEYPINSMMTLDGATPTPTETTATDYRFRVSVASGQTVSLPITAHGIVNSTWQLTNSNDAQFEQELSSFNHDPALEAVLQPVIAARRRQADMQIALDKVNARLAGLRSDEERQRANVTALNGADKTARERFVHDLNATEDQIAAAQKNLAAAQAALQAAKDDLAAKIESLQIDEKP